MVLGQQSKISCDQAVFHGSDIRDATDMFNIPLCEPKWNCTWYMIPSLTKLLIFLNLWLRYRYSLEQWVFTRCWVTDDCTLKFRSTSCRCTKGSWCDCHNPKKQRYPILPLRVLTCFTTKSVANGDSDVLAGRSSQMKTGDSKTKGSVSTTRSCIPERTNDKTFELTTTINCQSSSSRLNFFSNVLQDFKSSRSCPELHAKCTQLPYIHDYEDGIIGFMLTIWNVSDWGIQYQSSYPGTRRSQVIRQSLSDVTRGIKGTASLWSVTYSG